MRPASRWRRRSGRRCAKSPRGGRISVNALLTEIDAAARRQPVERDPPFRSRKLPPRRTAAADLAVRLMGSGAGPGPDGIAVSTVPDGKDLLSRHRMAMRLRVRLRRYARRMVRDSDVGRIVLAVAIAVIIALGVALIREAVHGLHHLLFEVPIEAHLSGAQAIPLWRRLLVPSLGGLVYGLIAAALWRWRPRDVVDAIEANALHGGRMSLLDSFRLTLLTVLSGGVRRLGRASKPHIRSSVPAPPRRSAGYSSCAATICGSLSDAAPPRRSPPRLMPRLPAPFMPSS